MPTPSIRTRLLSLSGKLSKKSTTIDKLVKRLIHLYAIVTSGRYTRGSLCILKNDKSEILLVETSYKQGKGFVGGLPNSRHEQPEQTVIREIYEEVGIKLTKKPDFIGMYVQKDIKHIDAVFTTSISEEEKQNLTLQDGELAGMDWHNREEAVNHLDVDGQNILDILQTWETNKHG